MVAGLSLTTALTVVFLFTIFMPAVCRRSSAFYTTLAGLIAIVVWEFVPALHVLQHVIYFEWLVCIIVFLLVAVIDQRPIKTPELVEEEGE
jgi:SSS family solute:Na+ symporter